MIRDFFTGGAFKSIESVAKEWIQTDKETAEAQAVMVKALDPNGKMRRDLAQKVTFLYITYVFVMLALFVLEFFGIGETYAINATTDKMVSLFSTISTLFGAIVTASFGVNGLNVVKGK